MPRQFRSMRGRELFRVLTRKPLSYEVARQRGSHRFMRSRAGYPPIVYAHHDAQDVSAGRVRTVLVDQVGLSERQALDLL